MAAQGEADDSLEDVPPDFECSICMKLFLDPVSVPCGHTFCRTCLERSLGYHGQCAICRAPVASGQGVNVLIRGIVAERFPRALARRRQELETELQVGEHEAEEARRREVAGGGEALANGDGAPAAGAAGNDVQVPILPLLRDGHGKTLLPHCRMEVELRSQESIDLVEYALQGGRRLGYMFDSVAWDEADRPVGVCMAVEGVMRAADRSYTVQLNGLFRFRLAEPPREHGERAFELGKCEAFFDVPLPLSELSDSAADLATADDADAVSYIEGTPPSVLQVARSALDLLEKQLVNVGQNGRAVYVAHFGDVPTLRAGATTSAAMEQLSFRLLGAIVCSDAARRRWLKSTDTRGRLEASRSLLVAAGSRPALDLPGARSWMNPGQSAFGSFALLLVIVAVLVAKALGVFERRSTATSQSDGALEDVWMAMNVF